MAAPDQGISVAVDGLELLKQRRAALTPTSFDDKEDTLAIAGAISA